MPIQLPYGSRPPNTTAASMLEQIKSTPQEQMILNSHELWANAGQNLGGFWWSRGAASTDFTSFTTTTTNGVMPLHHWQPMLNSNWTDNYGSCQVVVSAFVENAEVRFSLWDQDIAVSNFVVLTPPDGKPRWVQGTLTIPNTDINSYGPFRILTVEFKADIHDTYGRLHCVQAKVLYRNAANIPR